MLTADQVTSIKVPLPFFSVDHINKIKNIKKYKKGRGRREQKEQERQEVETKIQILHKWKMHEKGELSCCLFVYLFISLNIKLQFGDILHNNTFEQEKVVKKLLVIKYE